MKPHDLTQKAAALARKAPDQWRDFLAVLAEFTEHHRENLVNSQLADLPVNQGRAQILATLQKKLENCLVDAEKMKP